jgi:hypothetical protein
MAYTKSNLNKNTDTSTNKSPQNLWCRDCFGQYVKSTTDYECFKETNGCRLRKCPYSDSECRGAHSAHAIKPLKHISSFNRLDKSKYDWVNLYIGVIESLKRDSIKLINKEHINKVSKVILEDNLKDSLTEIQDATQSSSFTFIDVIKLWRELSCIYRKIQKEMPFKHAGHAAGNIVELHSSGYKYSDDVPTFYLNGSLEDVAWSFERILRYCPLHKKVEDNLSKHQQITVWDLCLATGLNCKEGVHYHDEHLCIDDFLTGTCSCQTQESINTQEVELQLKKLDLITKLTNVIESEISLASDSWQTSKTKSNKSKVPDPKQKIQKQIQNITEQINSLSTMQRMIHYTEQGMLPFNEQLQKYQKDMKDKEELVKPIAIKASWDHDITKDIVVTPAIKIIKFGKKK